MTPNTRSAFLYFGVLLCYFSTAESTVNNVTKFPANFRFGVATAAYQVEGAWNVSGKGENVWDHFTHYESHKIKDGSNGDIACDSYHNYKRDVEMLVELGVQFYRFSLSWTRLLPNGFANNVSQDGINYYNNLINELIKNGIEPMITLFHWDTPQAFQVLGGWTNELIVEQFEDYAKVAFENFGDRVKDWITFNEPFNMCLFGYGTRTGLVFFAPDLNSHGIGDYLCSHNVIKAHARAYHLYNNIFRATQKGKIGMASILLWSEPETNSAEDIMIAEKALQFNMGWFTHPVFSKTGDYPEVMKKEVAKMSKLQGYKHSRLPQFTPEEIEYIKGTYDYMGINYYTAVVYRNDGKRIDREVPSYENDLGYVYYQRDSWPTGASPWLKLHPKGLRDSLNWVRKEYGDVEIYITENGYSSKIGLNDEDRVGFFNTHLDAVLKAVVEDGVNVTAYTAWSLMDNFEWIAGYTERFGLYQVDFDSPNKTRTPRMSALAYKEIIRTRRIDPTYLPRIECIEEVVIDYMKVGLLILVIIIALILTSLILNCMCRSKKFGMWKYKLQQMECPP